jgi:hypothetical protein
MSQKRKQQISNNTIHKLEMTAQVLNDDDDISSGYDTPPDEVDIFMRPEPKKRCGVNPAKKYTLTKRPSIKKPTTTTTTNLPHIPPQVEPPGFFKLAMCDTTEAAKALICYMAFYAFVDHMWIIPSRENSPTEEEEEDGTGGGGSVQKIHCRDFQQLYCYLRSQVPGYDVPAHVQRQKSREMYSLSNHTNARGRPVAVVVVTYLLPPFCLTNLICHSPIVDRWFGLGIELVQTINTLIRTRIRNRALAEEKKVWMQKYTNRYSTNPSTNKEIPPPPPPPPTPSSEGADDLQMPNWEILLPFLIEAIRTPNLKIDLKPERGAVHMSSKTVYNQDPSVSEGDVEELVACFAMAPRNCSVSPQLSDRLLCCVRHHNKTNRPLGDFIPKDGSGCDEVDDSAIIPGLFSSNDSAIDAINDSMPRTAASNTTPSSSSLPGLPPHFFVSRIYAHPIEALWICTNIHTVVRGIAYEWYSTYVVQNRGRKMTSEEAIRVFYSSPKMKETLQMWETSMRTLHEFYEMVSGYLHKVQGK